ncbi:MAG TPA: nuclear transport factor 2 family protein [Anaerolineales bacterium]|nr:nuclear transport factor 2 family protein [Anaerolineales bacterium]
MEKGKLTQTEFAQLLHRLSDSWNNGNARQASMCFTEDALYTEPPDKQCYSGRDALFQFFGGESGRAGEMNMTWHHIIFDEEKQIGAGEFTFTYGNTVHGVTMIKVMGGLISNWREYWYASPLSWDEFTKKNSF